MEFTEIDREDFARLLQEIAETYMPFGNFGPKDYPPRGVPITDLPPEYLAWFKERGFPKGRFGELLEAVNDIKAVGADEVFAPIRTQRGGRYSLHKRRSKTDFKTKEKEE